MCIDATGQINALDRVHWYVQSVANTMSGSVMFWCSSTDLIPNHVLVYADARVVYGWMHGHVPIHCTQ